MKEARDCERNPHVENCYAFSTDYAIAIAFKRSNMHPHSGIIKREISVGMLVTLLMLSTLGVFARDCETRIDGSRIEGALVGVKWWMAAGDPY
jgi:hypothetical protein